jgi:hypothetical protein
MMLFFDLAVTGLLFIGLPCNRATIIELCGKLKNVNTQSKRSFRIDSTVYQQNK